MSAEERVEDEVEFGKGVIVYCSQHGRPHFTGWCTVSPRDKTRLASTVLLNAYDECRKCGYWLYEDWVNAGKPREAVRTSPQENVEAK